VRTGHIWDFYAAPSVPVSILYALPGKCALPATAKHLRISTGIKVVQAASRSGDPSRHSHSKELPMLDFILLALGLGFFALSIAYAFGCDHL